MRVKNATTLEILYAPKIVDENLNPIILITPEEFSKYSERTSSFFDRNLELAVATPYIVEVGLIIYTESSVSSSDIYAYYEQISNKIGSTINKDFDCSNLTRLNTSIKYVDADYKHAGAVIEGQKLTPSGPKSTIGYKELTGNSLAYPVYKITSFLVRW